MRFYGFCSQWRRVKKWSVSILVLALLAVVVVGSSCTDNNGNQTTPAQTTPTQTTSTQTTPAQTTEVKSLDIRIQRISPDTGLRVLFIPKDDDGFLVRSEGSVNAALWMQSGQGLEAIKGELVQEWGDIRVTEEDYPELFGFSVGVSIDLNYSEPQSFPKDIYGILEVTLTLPDGTMLYVEITEVKIATSYSCC